MIAKGKADSGVDSRGDPTLYIDGRWIGCSGIGSYLWNLLPIIREKVSQRMVLLGNHDGAKEFASCHGFEYLHFPARGFSVQEQLLFRRLICGPGTLWVPTISIPLLSIKDLRIITTIHDVVHMALSSGLRRSLYKLYYRRALSISEAVITDSEFSRSEIARFFPGFEQKVSVIPLGLHRPVAEVQDPATLSSWEARRPYILSVGNIKPHKNIPRLIRAFEMIADSIPHHLFVIGRSDGFITGAGATTTNNARIHFTGFLSDEEVQAAYAFADLFVFPSLYEGYGLPPLEAMSYGVPVVASTAASIPEVCGDAALYCNPLEEQSIAESMLTLLTDEQKRSEFIQKGTKHVQRLSWDSAAERTLSILRGKDTGE